MRLKGQTELMRVVVTRIGVDEQVVLAAEPDLSGPLYDLVTVVLAIGQGAASSR
jgi:hypothetical protein